jgi:hypothetical protein
MNNRSKEIDSTAIASRLKDRSGKHEWIRPKLQRLDARDTDDGVEDPRLEG